MSSSSLRRSRAGRREFLAPEQHGRANAIGVGIDGFPCAEELDDSPTRTADALERLCMFVQRFDRLRLLRLAAIDMDFVASAAGALASEEHATLRTFARVLETGIIVTYARPYLDSNQPALGKKWRPKDPDDLALHLHVIDEYRSAYHAHSDRTPGARSAPPTFLGWMQLPPMPRRGTASVLWIWRGWPIWLTGRLSGSPQPQTKLANSSVSAG